MPIKFQCPKCKRGLTVKDELAGKRGSCPDCKTIMTVPAASTPPTAPAAPARPAKAPAPVAPPAGAASPPAAPVRKPPSPARPAARPAPAQAKAPPPASVDGRGAAKREQPAAPAEPAAPEPPARPPEDIEAEAAALLADEPVPQAAPEVKNIDFQCPYCDEQIQLPLELAGKKSPCPKCKHIIKVPDPTNKGPKDWRQADARLPLGARRPDQPAPEGAWGTETVGRASAQALTEAGVIKPPARPRTLWQKIRLPVAAAAVLIVGVATTFATLAWMAHQHQKQALDYALSYAGSDGARQKIHPAGQGALYSHAGEYFLRQQKPGCGKEARKQLSQAQQALRSASGTERDLVLIELALQQISMAGSAEEARMELRSTWPDTLRALQAALEAIEAPNGRLEALHQVCPQLMAAGQAERIVPLVSQLYPAADAGRAEALSVAGLLLLAGGEPKEAGRALEQALAVFPDKKSKKKAPLVRAPVVVLARALKKDPPEGSKEPSEDEERHIGEAGGLARQGQWEQARQLAGQENVDPKVRFRALLAVASAAIDGKAGSTDVEAVVQMALRELPAVLRNEPSRTEREKLSWQLLRLTRLGLRGSLGGDVLARLTALIDDTGLRGWAQLDLLRPRLDPKGGGIEEAALDQVDSRTLAHLLACYYLARFRTRQDAGWAKTVKSWEDPRRAFGSLGVALGLQDRDKGM